MKKYFLILISLITLFGGCCQEDITYLIPERKVLRFKLNDMFIYKNDSLNIDTLKVIKVTDTIIFVKTYKNLNCAYSELYQKLDIKLSMFRNGRINPDQIDAQFSQYNFPEYNLNVKNWLGFNASSRLIRKFIGRYTIGENTYYNITLATDSTLSNHICKIYYNNENGVVSYETNTGNIYDLEEYIPVGH